MVGIGTQDRIVREPERSYLKADTEKVYPISFVALMISSHWGGDIFRVSTIEMRTSVWTLSLQTIVLEGALFDRDICDFGTWLSGLVVMEVDNDG